MVDDPDVQRCAKFLLERDGGRALSIAQQRAAELLMKGQAGAAKVWQQIADAIAAARKSADRDSS